MTGLVPWVVVALRRHIKSHPELFNQAADVPVYEHQPLRIVPKDGESESVLKSYKPPWDKQDAANALASTDRYEAAGNIAWVRLFPLSKDMNIVAGDPVLWSQVEELASDFFVPAATTPGAVSRIMFPFTLHVNAPKDMKIAAAAHYQSCLDLISGHAFVYAWWFAMFKALRDDAATLVSALWQCGLTTTLHLRQGLSVTDMSQISCWQSEMYKASDKNASDSFPAFALKALLMAPSGQEVNRLKILNDLNIKYNGAVVNKALAIAAASHPRGPRTTCHHAATQLPPCCHRTVTARLRRDASTRLLHGRHSHHIATMSPPDSPRLAVPHRQHALYRHRSQATLNAIILFEEKITPQTVECLRQIEHISGRATLTGAYNKLIALCRACTKIGEASKETSESKMACIQSLTLWVCQALRFGLRYEMISPGSVTVDSLDQKNKGATEGPLSSTHVWAARKFVRNHVASMLEDVRGVADAGPLMQELDEVMQYFVDYPSFEKAFKNSAATPVATGDEEGCDNAPAESEDVQDAGDQLDELLQKYNCKPTPMVANFLFDLLSGVMDEKVKAACEGCKDNLRDIDYASKNGMEALRDIKRALSVYKTVVPATLPGAPTTPGPGAATPGTDADAASRERDAVWQRATAKRKAMAVVGHGRITSKQQAQAFYEKCSTVYRFQPKDKEAHRVFLFSADLFTECRNAPMEQSGSIRREREAPPGFHAVPGWCGGCPRHHGRPLEVMEAQNRRHG